MRCGKEKILSRLDFAAPVELTDPMPSQPPRRAYVVSAPLHDAKAVYAVLASSEADAFRAVAESVGVPVHQVELVGMFSRKVVRTLKLKPGEVRPV